MEEKKEVAYNASAIVNIFSNVLNSDATKKIILARGIYIPGRGQNYNGVYYDQLKDETTDACITLIVPAIIRVNLEANKVIECHAFLTKKVQVNGARIELRLNVTELLAQKESQFTEEQIASFKILQRKAEIGYQDVDSFFKAKIISKNALRSSFSLARPELSTTTSSTSWKKRFPFMTLNLSASILPLKRKSSRHWRNTTKSPMCWFCQEVAATI